MPADQRFNRVLASLVQGDRLPWADHLELVDLPARHELQSCEASALHVHFPTSALVVLMQASPSGDEAPVALVGNDGVVGVAAFMGTLPEASRAVVIHPGHAWRLPASLLSTEVPGPSQVLKATVGYLISLTSQLSQTAFCQQHHNVEQRPRAGCSTPWIACPVMRSRSTLANSRRCWACLLMRWRVLPRNWSVLVPWCASRGGW